MKKNQRIAIRPERTKSEFDDVLSFRLPNISEQPL